MIASPMLERRLFYPRGSFDCLPDRRLLPSFVYTTFAAASSSDAHPPAGCVLEIFGGRRRKGGAFGLPHETLDIDLWVIDADHVEGIGFTPATCRGCRAGGNNERAMSGDLVPLGRVPCMADV